MNWYCFNLETELKKSPKLERKHKVRSSLLEGRKQQKSDTFERTPLQNGPVPGRGPDKRGLLVNAAVIR